MYIRNLQSNISNPITQTSQPAKQKTLAASPMQFRGIQDYLNNTGTKYQEEQRQKGQQQLQKAKENEEQTFSTMPTLPTSEEFRQKSGIVDIQGMAQDGFSTDEQSKIQHGIGQSFTPTANEAYEQIKPLSQNFGDLGKSGSLLDTAIYQAKGLNKPVEQSLKAQQEAINKELSGKVESRKAQEKALQDQAKYQSEAWKTSVKEYLNNLAEKSKYDYSVSDKDIKGEKGVIEPLKASQFLTQTTTPDTFSKSSLDQQKLLNYLTLSSLVPEVQADPLTYFNFNQEAYDKAAKEKEQEKAYLDSLKNYMNIQMPTQAAQPATRFGGGIWDTKPKQTIPEDIKRFLS